MTHSATPRGALSAVQINLDAMKTARDLLREKTAALVGGQFHAANNGQPTLDQRLNHAGSAVDASMEWMQQRVADSIQSSLERLDAMQRFGVSQAQKTYAVKAQCDHAPVPDDAIIDVQARPVEPTP